MSSLKEVDYVFREFPWKLMSVMLNELAQSIERSQIEAEAFKFEVARREGEASKSDEARPLPEDSQIEDEAFKSEVARRLHRYYSQIEAEAFPKSEEARPLPEDYAVRGILWVNRYYPDNWFTDDKTDDDEKYMEFASMEQTRKERVLYLGCRIAAQGGKWLRYDAARHRFDVAPEFDVALVQRSPGVVSVDDK